MKAEASLARNSTGPINPRPVEPAEGDLAFEPATASRIGKHRRRHLGFDDGWGKAVDADAVGPELDRHRLGETFDRMF